jgi:NTE family protein
MKDRALVLGGGGAVGVAWETGLAAGLLAGGLDLTKSDYIQGTSAGSIVGASLARGLDPTATYDAHLAAARTPAASGAAPSAPPDLSRLITFMMRFPTDAEPGLDLRRELGEFSRSSATISEDQLLANMTALGAAGDWPEHFACTAVDATSGEFHIWRKSDGVDLVRAIASSCSVPGVFPPVTINGRRWMDGGMRSSFSIDQATGYSRVVAVAVIPTPMAEPMVRPRLEREANILRAQGAKVESLVPDAAAMSVFGMNLMDPSRREPALEAGLAQGKREAERLKQFWN